MATDAVEQAMARMNQEIEAALDALGPYGGQGLGAELVDWAHKLSAGIAAQAQERSRAA